MGKDRRLRIKKPTGTRSVDNRNKEKEMQSKEQSPIEKYFTKQAPWDVVGGPPMEPIRGEVRFITPEIARHILGDHENFRGEKKSIAKKYEAVMRRKKWIQKSPPLIFSESGELLDGQHRLHAVILSGIPDWFNCVVGDIDPLSVDANAVRTQGDVMKYAAREGIIDMQDFVKKSGTAARNIHCGAWDNPMRYATLTNADYPELFNKYRDAIMMIRERGLFTAPLTKAHIYGAFGRAWIYHEDRRGEIEDAAKAFSEMNCPTGRYSPIKKLIDSEVRCDALAKKGKHPRTVFYLKAANAIQKFLDREELKRNLYAASEDPFPIEKLGY